jgi:hypothetical protein
MLKKNRPLRGRKIASLFFKKRFDSHEKNGYIISVRVEAITIPLLKKVL